MNLTVTVGIPGSGKSTWAARHAADTGARLFTTDPIRIDDRNVVRFLNRMRHDVDMALAAGDDVVIDACNVQTSQRTQWLRMGRRHGATCIAAIIDADPNDAIDRNDARPQGERVPAERMTSYVAAIGQALRRVRLEPWHRIVTVGAVTTVDIAPILTTSRDW